jgi:hypothetical protein
VVSVDFRDNTAQVELMNGRVTVPGQKCCSRVDCACCQRLKPRCKEPLSNCAFNDDLCRYKEACGIPPEMVRLSVGLETIEDILEAWGFLITSTRPTLTLRTVPARPYKVLCSSGDSPDSASRISQVQDPDHASCET